MFFCYNAVLVLFMRPSSGSFFLNLTIAPHYDITFSKHTVIHTELKIIESKKDSKEEFLSYLFIPVISEAAASSDIYKVNF